MIVPASIRNNNPGAMYPGASAKKFGSRSFETLTSKDGVHKIATFATAIHGAAALFDLLARSYTGMTIEKAIARWCGGYYVSTYLKVLEQQSGIKPTDVLTRAMVRDPATAVPIARAMAWQEAGRDFPLSEEEWVAAHAMAFGDGEAPAFSPNNDVPSPKPETRAMAVLDKVGKAATGVATAGTAGAGLSLPAPPDVSGLTAWKAAALQVQELATWVGGNLEWVATAGGLYLLLGWALPAWAARRS